MKVLLSAYAFGPGVGSEPGVGWNWATEIAKRGHEVWVIACSIFQQADIEEYLIHNSLDPRIHIVFYDIPRKFGWWYRPYRGIRTHYLMWQWGAYRSARRLHAVEGFDVVHHITFGSIRFPSFMGGLGIPFFLGPLGGGERAPWRLRTGYGLRGLIWDFVRDVSNTVVRFDPFVRRTFRRASEIYSKTAESKNAIPKSFQSKSHMFLEIGISAAIIRSRSDSDALDTEIVRLLYVGRFRYFKGVDIGLRATAGLLEGGLNANLTVVGRGYEKAMLKALAEKLKIDSRIEWRPWVDQKDVFSIYNEHDVFLFPSLHDSSGNVVLEAMSQGLPVVCLDLGGPAMMVDESCGRVVATAGRSRSEVIGGLTAALAELAGDPALRRKLSQGAIRRAREFTWEKVVDRVYRRVESHNSD